ncbi:hypothetical protein OAA24_00190 [bacterium]|nr:hypothetical protein [bacterium]
MSKLILISDIIETRLRKEKEIEYYQKQLEKIQTKMFFLKKDLDITTLIIDMIEKERVVDFKEQMEDKTIMLGNNNVDKTETKS